MEDYILFSFAGLEFTKYGLIIGAGCLLWLLSALILRRYLNTHYHVPASSIAFAGFLMMLFGTVFSRIVYCLAKYEKYMYAYETIPLFTEGGASMCGAVIGAALGLALSSFITRTDTAHLADCFAPGFGLFAAAVVLAQLTIGEGWGKLTQSIGIQNSMLSVIDRYGDSRFAVYRMELASCAMVCLACVMLMPEKLRPGALTNVALGIYCALRIVTVSMREGEVLALEYFRIDQLAAMGLLLIMCIRAVTVTKSIAGRIWRILAFLAGAGLATLMEFKVDSGSGIEQEYMLMLLGSITCLAAALIGTVTRRSIRGGGF